LVDRPGEVVASWNLIHHATAEVRTCLWQFSRSLGIILGMNALSKEESDRLLDVLETYVRNSEVSQRELERRLGVSQGYLGALFQKRIQLKVFHVYGIARVLGLEPLYFFMRATPPRDPGWLLEQLGIKQDLISSFPDDGHPPSREEMQQIIRTTIRSELERLFGVSFKPEEPDPVQG
jgi:transcriptional regulator with XRE-family HTH domain